MKFLIQLSFTDLDAKSLETDVLIKNYADKEKHDLAYNTHACLLDIEHPRTNFILEKLESTQHQILVFSKNKQFIEVFKNSTEDRNFSKDSEIQWLLVLPHQHSIRQDELNTLLSFQFSYSLDIKTRHDLVRYMNKNWGISPFTRTGGMVTTIRRMDAEKKLDIPSECRSGVTISVRNGKRTSEMTDQEREIFRQQLIDAVRKSSPSAKI